MLSVETFRKAVINPDLCQPKKCNQECKRQCPVNAQGRACIEVSPQALTALINEDLCTGCNICTKVCPFGAIYIVNLPNTLKKACLHQYGINAFSLYRLPAPKLGSVLGLLGRNGTGKSTAIRVLAGKLVPNLGDETANWSNVIRHFRGNTLQNYFNKMVDKSLRIAVKPQNIIAFATVLGNGTVASKLEQLKLTDLAIEKYGNTPLLDKEISTLSGGELQRLSIATICNKDADSYLFDEPSSFLDIKQRLRACQWIRECSRADSYVVAVEHDLAVLDYMSDIASFFYGVPAGYGIVTTAMNVRDGLNSFLDGYLAKENVRFRDDALDFRDRTLEIADTGAPIVVTYPSASIVLGSFTLNIDAGELRQSEVVVLLGENGCGKTTWLKHIRTLGGFALKPQFVQFTKKTDTVKQRFTDTCLSALSDTIWCQTVLKPLGIERLMNLQLQTLSGGEEQIVAIALTLGKKANVYLFDEPSCFLDTEQRIAVARTLRKFATQYNCLITVVEHDFMMASYMADRVIVFDGEPGRLTYAGSPEPVSDGMNRFLKHLNVTFRRVDGRPRINKHYSQKDKEQQLSGIYWPTATTTTNELHTGLAEVIKLIDLS